MKRIPICLAILLALGAWAQPDPNNPPPPEPPPQNNATMMIGMMSRTFEMLPPRSVATDQGYFQLQLGVLAKYDPATMKELGSVDLLGPEAPWPKDGKFPTPDDETLATVARARRMVPGLLVADGPDVVAVLGSTFYRIDGATLQVKVTTRLLTRDPVLQELTALAMGKNANAEGFIAWLVASSPIVSDRALYLTIGGDNLAINLADGTVRGQGPRDPVQLEHLFPTAPPNGPQRQDNPDVLGDGDKVVLVGVVARHDKDNTPVWTLKDERGVEVTLTGDPAMKLAAGEHGEGARVLLSGTFRKEKIGVPDFGGGVLEVSAYLVLERPKP